MWRNLLVCLVVLAACGGASGDRETLTVFAASSLTDVFTRIADDFETAHPEVDVVLSFAGSSELVAQIAEGAPADVVATADEVTMARLDLDPVVFATNRLEIAVERGNPLGISGLADLADPGLIVVRCADVVPCGAYAREATARAGVAIAPASLEQNVKAVVTKVELGEADAGIAYATDIRVADVDGVPIAGSSDLVARYPIAVVDASGPAADFVAHVTGDAGAAALAEYGFGQP